jgi:glycogen synthase
VSSWQTLMRNGMSRDFSWGASAREYGKIYERARQARASADAAPVTADLKREPVLG